MTKHERITMKESKLKNPLLLITRLNYELHPPRLIRTKEMEREHYVLYMRVLKIR